VFDLERDVAKFRLEIDALNTAIAASRWRLRVGWDASDHIIEAG
jgi:hypothetical protein